MKFRLAVLLSVVMLMPSCSRKDQPQDKSPTPTDVPSNTDTAPPTATTNTDTSTQPVVDTEPLPEVTWQPGEAVRIPGTPISIAPPPQFELADTFLGLVRKDKGASIKIVESPAPLDQIAAGLEDENALKQREMTVVSSRQVTLGSDQGRLYKVRQTLLGKEFGKWILVVGDDTRSVMVTGTYPFELASELSAPMEKSMLTVTWQSKSPAESAAELPFAITVESPLKLATKMGDTLVYTIDGQFPLSRMGEPVIYVSSSLSRFPVTNPRAFAETRLGAISAIKDVKIVESTAIEVDKLGAHEIIADAADAESGKPLRIYQLMIFQQENYFTVTCLVSADQASSYENTFRRIGRSFTRKNP